MQVVPGIIQVVPGRMKVVHDQFQDYQGKMGSRTRCWAYRRARVSPSCRLFEFSCGGTTTRFELLIDVKRFRRVALIGRCLFDILYVWDTQSETVLHRQGQDVIQEFPPDLQRLYDTRRRCSKCGDRDENAVSCPHEVWTPKMFIWKYFGTALFGS